MAEITLDVVKEALGTNASLKQGLIGILKEDFIKGAETEGMVVRTKEQDEQYHTSRLNTVLPAEVEKKFTVRYKENLDQIDAEILAITGIAKQSVTGAPGEKTIDYAKRAFKEFHSKGGDPVTKERVKQLEEILQKKETEFTTKQQQFEKQLFETEVNSQLDTELEKKQIYVPPHITKEEDKQRYIQDQKRAAKHGLLSAFTHKRDDQGNIIWHDTEGKPQLDSKDGKPRKLGSLLDERYSSWFVPGTHVVTGTGTGTQTGAAGTGQFKNKEEIHKHLASQGLDALSAPYQEQFVKIATDNKITI